MTVNVDKKWFVDRWTEKGLTLRKMARLMGVDPSALSRTLKGERELKVLEVGKMASILEVSPGEVLARFEGAGEGSAATAKAPAIVRISHHPGFGFMKGLIKFEEGFDGTGPYDDEPWDQGYLGGDSR
ncbi:MAG: helix-turn-helix transcriptional regulator [Rhizobiaceae bacterium]|nr:helix-turn-helix transcriptional regulator [Rhizobiaceae bacterium]